MKVKITAGTFGHRVGDRVIAVKAGDPPINVTDEVGARLISCGVAVALEEEKPRNQDAALSDYEALDFPDYDAKMSREKLEEIALSIGIDQEEIDEATKKADLIALIDEAKDSYDADSAPTFDPESDIL